MGFFDNAKTVFINNKEVKSIVTSDGGVLFRKSSPASISLVADKTIFMKDETCTLTATVLDDDNEPVEGETVSFDFLDSAGGSVIENIGTDTTDSLGVASVSFTGKGTGDLYIRCSDGMLLQETYVIDAHYHSNTVYSSSTTLSIPEIPTNFKVLFKSKRGTGLGWLEIGADAQNNYFVGQTSDRGYCGMYVRVNNTYASSKYTSGIFTTGSTQQVEWAYKDGVHTVKVDGILIDSITTTNSSISARNYQKVNISGSNTISDITILPL